MAGALATIAVLLLQRIGVMNKFAYFLVGLALWYSLYKAGLHPTLAGVVMGMLAPATPLKKQKLKDDEDGVVTIVEELEEQYHSLSTLVVVPIFAFANSGVVLSSDAVSAALNSPIAWGIVLGLAVGKPLGIFLLSKLTSVLRIAELPAGSGNKALVATGGTAGIGFTVAIFIAKLAFDDVPTQDLAVTAVIVGSLLSGLLSVALFRMNGIRSNRSE
jgi:NhaA family Na+:H+ antiporter